MTTAVREADLVDEINDLEERIRKVETSIGPAFITTIEPGSLSGGWDPVTSSLTVSHLAAGSIITDKLYAGDLDAYKIKAEHIAANAIEAKHIKAVLIDTDSIQFGTAEGDFLSVGSIAVGGISATKIKTATLEAGGALIGGLTSGHINTGAITAGKIAAAAFEGYTFSLKNGGFFYTGDSGTPRLVMGTSVPVIVGGTPTTRSGLLMLNASNGITFWADPATGNVELRGTIKTGSTGLGNFDDKIAAKHVPAMSVTVANPADPTTSATHILMDGLNVGTMAAGSIAGGTIVADSITAAQIAAGTITAAELNVVFGGRNLLPNSGFEDTSVAANTPVTIPGWPTAVRCTTRRSTSSARSGNSALRVVSTITDGNTTYAQSLPIEVQPGVTYTASAYCRQVSGGKSVRIDIGWYDENNASISTIIGSSSVPSAIDWNSRRTTTGVAPANAAFAYIRLIQINATSVANTTDFDDVQFEAGITASTWSLAVNDLPPNSVLTTHIGPGEIRTGNIGANQINATHVEVGSLTADLMDFRVGGRNILVNSAGALGTTGWSNRPSTVLWSPGGVVAASTNGQLSHHIATTTPGAAGLEGLGMVAGASNMIFRANTTYTFSGYVRVPTTTSSPLQLILGTTTDNATAATANVTTTWRRYYVSWTPTADRAGNTVYCGFRTPSSTNAAYWFTRFQLEEGDVATEWKQNIQNTVIDGSTVTGALIRTAISGARLEMDTTGLYAKDAADLNDVSLTADGGLTLKADTVGDAVTRQITWSSGSWKAGLIQTYINASSNSWSYWKTVPFNNTFASTCTISAQTAVSTPSRFANLDLYQSSTEVTSRLLAHFPAVSEAIVECYTQASGSIINLSADEIRVNGLLSGPSSAVEISRIRVNGYASATTHLIAVNALSTGSSYPIDATVDGVARFQVRQNGNTYTNGGVVASVSRRDTKDEIKNASFGLDEINQVKVRQFKYKDKLSRQRGKQIGVIAEEIVDPFPEFVFRDEQDRPDSVGYSLFGVAAIKGVQDLNSSFESVLKESRHSVDETFMDEICEALEVNPLIRKRIVTAQYRHAFKKFLSLARIFEAALDYKAHSHAYLHADAVLREAARVTHFRDKLGTDGKKLALPANFNDRKRQAEQFIRNYQQNK